MSQALLHVSAGPRNSVYHIACQIFQEYRKYIYCILLHNSSDFVFGWGRKIFAGEGD